jgi:hypothetical protein
MGRAAECELKATSVQLFWLSMIGSWYMDASWKTRAIPIASLDQLRRGPVVSVDLNVGHLAVSVLDCSGNVIGLPPRAGSWGQPSVAWQEGQEVPPSHLGAPDRQARHRLAQMAYNAGVAVIAVDPAYTSKWGAEHWLAPLNLKAQFNQEPLTGHHAASVVIGRRGLGQRARRRGMCARTSPEDEERPTAPVSAGWPEPAQVAGLPEPLSTRHPRPRMGRRQPPDGRTRRPRSGGRKTVMPTGSEGRQVAQDHSGPPAGRCPPSRSV